MKTLLCAVSHGLYSPWLEILKNGQEKTWLNDPIPKNLEVLHYHGTPVGTFLQVLDRAHEKIRWSNRHLHRAQALVDNFFLFPWSGYIPRSEVSELLIAKPKTIHIRFQDTYLTYRWKFLGLIKYFIEQTSHDFLFTTTTASYINLQVLSGKVEELNSESLYYGGKAYDGAEFISGAHRIISRDVAFRILSMKGLWPAGTIEDVALGKLLAKSGIEPSFIPLNNISTLEELDSKSDEFLRENYHFRLKAGLNTQRGDVKIMMALHDRLRSK